MPTDLPTDLLLRPAEAGDAGQVAEIHLVARRAARMPPGVHPPHEVREWVATRVAGDPVWVAELAGAVVGYARFPGAWLDDLYVHPDHQGLGIGSALLDVVKAQRPSGFCLWVFESNGPARTFYQRRGLVSLEHTDGSAQRGGAPPTCGWPGPARSRWRSSAASSTTWTRSWATCWPGGPP